MLFLPDRYHHIHVNERSSVMQFCSDVWEKPLTGVLLLCERFKFRPWRTNEREKAFVKCLHLAYVEYYVPISVFNAMIVWRLFILLPVLFYSLNDYFWLCVAVSPTIYKITTWFLVHVERSLKVNYIDV